LAGSSFANGNATRRNARVALFLVIGRNQLALDLRQSASFTKCLNGFFTLFFNRSATHPPLDCLTASVRDIST
jgi:hypothetical protein